MTLSHQKRSDNAIRNTVGLSAILMTLLGLIFYSYEYYLRVAPSVMSSELKFSFNMSEAAFGHLAACYYYAYTPLQIPAGILMDKFGPRRILSFACFLCAIGTFLFAEVDNLVLAQCGRLLVGAGSAFAYVGVLKITSQCLPSSYFAPMAGICTALGMLGGIFGLNSITRLMSSVGWEQTLYYAGGVGIVISIALWIGLQEKSKITSAHLSNASSKESLVKFSFRSVKIMIGTKQLWLIGIIGCLTYLPISVFAELWAIPYLKALGYTSKAAAHASSLALLGFAVGGPCWGLISEKIKQRRIILLLNSFIASCILTWIIFVPNHSIQTIFIGLFTCTFFASAEVLVFAISNDLYADEMKATAAAFTNMLVMLGGALLQPLVGLILDLLNSYNVPLLTLTPHKQDFVYALSILPLLLMCAAILSLFLKETYIKNTQMPNLNA